MKVYLRDRITAGLGVSVLAVLAAMSYYYSIHTETEALRAEIIRESPDFTSTNIALTQFKADGTAERRIFADYAEHYEDGRMTSLRPRLVTLSVDKPQVKASADTGISSDAGETVHLRATLSSHVRVIGKTHRCALKPNNSLCFRTPKFLKPALPSNLSMVPTSQPASA